MSDADSGFLNEYLFELQVASGLISDLALFMDRPFVVALDVQVCRY